MICFDYLARLKRKVLSSDYISELVNKTPGLADGTSRTFRDLQDRGNKKKKERDQFEPIINFISEFAGIISYTEYLFLLSILTSESLFQYCH